LRQILPGSPHHHRFLSLQPTTTFGVIGTGWTGVRKWCQETWQRKGSNLEILISESVGAPLDLLIIQVDADIAGKRELQDGLDEPIPEPLQPCPPITQTTDKMKQIIGCWLSKHILPERVVLAIPAEDMETWVFAALYPDDALCHGADFECIHAGRTRSQHPGFRLPQKRYCKIIKSEKIYRQIAPRVGNAWETVCRLCIQAEIFDREVDEQIRKL
jgi:hypothetical protein